jgi:hypothetical protein
MRALLAGTCGELDFVRGRYQVLLDARGEEPAKSISVAFNRSGTPSFFQDSERARSDGAVAARPCDPVTDAFPGCRMKLENQNQLPKPGRSVIVTVRKRAKQKPVKAIRRS